MEKRLKALEVTVQDYGRRHDDCERDRLLMNTAIAELKSWKATIQESTEVQREMVEVGRSILKALGWVGVGAKWIIAIGTALGMVYMAAKALAGLKWL